MYTNILTPTDGSGLSKKAITEGITLAKEIGAKITALTVTTPFHVVSLDTWMLEDTRPQYEARMREQAARILASIIDEARMAGVPCHVLHVEHEHPYQAIIDTAKSQGCDLIIMASHGRRGIASIVLGSETVKVLTHSKLPVLVHR
jgi:nucleotide-binding universal stress UspA family protein